LPVPAGTSPALNLSTQLGGKRLELLKEAVSRLARVAVLYDPAIPGTALEVKEDLPGAARGLGLTVWSWEIPAADSFERVFAALTKEWLGGLYVLGAGQLMRANGKPDRRLCVKEPVTVGVLLYSASQLHG
jgi:hypothetical protein